MLETILFTLGLNEEEARIYSLLLETGAITAGELAKKAGVPRSSLYGFLQKLNEQGLVIELSKAGIKLFSAENPDKVSLLFDERIENLQKQQSEYKKILPDLRAKNPAKAVTPKLQIFEGADGLKNVLKDMLLYYDMETQAFWPIKQMIDILGPDFFRYLNKERIKNNLYTRAIWPQSQMVNIEDHPYLGAGDEFKREIRIAPEHINFSMGYWIYGNKVAFLSSRKESFGFIIESAELVEMLLMQFNVLWEISKVSPSNKESNREFLGELQ